MPEKQIEVWSVQDGVEQRINFVSRNTPGNTTVVLSPPTVGAISLGTVTSNSVTVTWTAATASSNAPVTGYTVYRGLTGTNVSAATRSHTYTGLTPATTYSFQVSATNSAGTSAKSNTVTTTTPAAPTTGTFYGVLNGIPGLTHYYPLDDVSQAQDMKGTLHGTVTGGVSFDANGATFNGSNYITIPDSPDFSLATTDQFSIVVFNTVTNWSEGTRGSNGYVHWMGKGATGTTQEWALRHYFDPDTSGESPARTRRTSAYHFNPGGGLGAGSFFQDLDSTSTERVITVNMDATTTTGVTGANAAFPGAIWMYKNGVERDADGLAGTNATPNYNISPQNTTSPVRIGTRDLASFFIGRIRRVAFFNRKLTQTEINTIYNARNLPERDTTTTSRPAVGAFIGTPYTYTSYVADFGTPTCNRTYSSGMIPASINNSPVSDDISRGIPVHLYSFKPAANSAAGLADVTNGVYDNTINSFLDSAIAALPANDVLWICFYHEPEDNIELGQFTHLQWRNATAKVAGLVKAKNSPKLKTYICLMGWTFQSGSPRDPADYWDSRFDTLIDGVGYDPYYASNVSNNSYLGPCEAFSASKGKPTIMAEISISVFGGDKQDTNGNSTVGNVAQRVAAVNDLWARAKTNNYAAIAWFETIQDLSDPAVGGDATYLLHYDAGTMAAWKAIQAEARS